MALTLGSRTMAMRPLRRGTLLQGTVSRPCNTVRGQLVPPPPRCPLGIGRQLYSRSRAFNRSSHTSQLRSETPGTEPLEVEVCSLDINTPFETRQKQQAGASGRSTIWRAASWDLFLRQPQTALLLSIAGAFTGAMGTGFDMQGPTSVVEALAVLAAIVTVHECGHFLAARLQNIHVTKFSIGFGPALLSYQGAEVEYSLRAIPLGGYVGFPDDDPSNGFPKDDPDLLQNRGVKDRALVISAGVIANFIFAFLILLGQVNTVGVAELALRSGVKIPEVVAGSVAERAGLRVGDVILAVDGQEIPPIMSSVPAVVREIKDNPEKELRLTVERGKETFVVPVVPSRASDGGGRIGVQLATNGVISHTVARNPIKAVQMASREFSKLLGTVTNGLKQLVFNFNETKDAISGPVAIVAVGAEVARSDITGLFQFAAIVNINLAVVNLLPLPALGGGSLALLLVEAARGKTLPDGVETGITRWGLIAIIMFSLALLIMDAALDGGYLALLIVEAARGKKLPDGVEAGIMASGLLLLLTVGLVLLVRDTLTLSGLG